MSKSNRNNKHSNKIQSKIPPKWFYLILFFLPISFFLFLETGLRAFNYGNDFPVFVEALEYDSSKIWLNPERALKYFPNLKLGPGVVPDAFDKIKNKNSFRIFVLGESSTAGWPFIYTASFPAELKRRLELLYPENVIEVINCGISAINTYTIRDIVPDIIEQQPDLILIYTGHNEYYGALGVASTASFGKLRFLVNTYLCAIKFKTVQLLADVVSGLSFLFSTPNNKSEAPKIETLMSAMIEESLIPLNSKLYNLGVEQFEGNINDILRMFKEENIPVIMGTSTCNTKDLKPFISVKFGNLPPAEMIYKDAKKNYTAGNITKAEELFSYAKDLDALKFRAPERINNIIKMAAQQYKLNLVDIDSIFKKSSVDGIVGYNLTVDHLHPNILGHRLIAKSFFLKMDESNFLPKGRRENILTDVQDSLLVVNFPFTSLDSVLAYLRTIQLTGFYPFVPKNQPNLLLENFKPEDFVDSTALKVLNYKISWGTAHIDIAMLYYNKGEFKKFMKEMDAIIAAKPFYDKSYEQTIDMLIEAKLFSEAVPYLNKLHYLKPSFFTNKWLGYIALQKNNFAEAQKYFEQSLNYSDSDYQVWYNLAGIYYNKKEFTKALTAIERSLVLNPDYSFAKNVYQKLKGLINK